jgi:CTP synthase (UTP-ammonia lyase)
MPSIRIGLVGDWNGQQKSHHAIPKALEAASDRMECVWIPSDTGTNAELLNNFGGFWCVPGMPYRSAEGVLRIIRHARVSRTPFVGTSAGFQYALIEYARNVAGLPGADHQKSNPKTDLPLIAPLGCALAGVKARVRFTVGSRLRRAYAAAESIEEYHCSFGLNDRYRRLLEGRDLYVSAVDDQDEVRAVELDGHPFFVATLFQPELRPDANPLAGAFVTACIARSDLQAAKDKSQPPVSR